MTVTKAVQTLSPALSTILESLGEEEDFTYQETISKESFEETERAAVLSHQCEWRKLGFISVLLLGLWKYSKVLLLL